MLQGIWGKKVGMTQVFTENNKVVPVTVVDVNNWIVTRRKTTEKDGYDALQLGCLKNRYKVDDFKTEWLKKPNQYFSFFKEVCLVDASADVNVGQKIDANAFLEAGQMINAFGITKGRGFAGVVKRHNFAGGKASHGSNMGRRPGSIGNYCSQGRVTKGAKLPGHMGVEKRAMKNLKVIQIDPEANIVLVAGSVPGTAGSTIYMQKI